jgi:ABC-type lipoprotein export system ATPase subunit
MSEVFVSLEEVSRAYPGGAAPVPALAQVSCQVRAGDRLAILGPSGSGKSTLLHVMGGLEAPTSGRVCWPALGSRERLRPDQIGFVFQTISLLPALTVLENIELSWLLSKRDAAGARAAAEKAVTLFGLATIADKLPEEISGGQAQRAAVGRALVCRPRMILADEPTGQLDHTTAQRVFDELLTAIAGTDTALVVATHDLALANRMDTKWHLRHGILEETDT